MNERYFKVWLAGFFDGEGSVGVYHHKGNWVVQVQLGQMDRTIPDMVKERYGGSVCKTEKNSYYRWVASSKTAGDFLEDIFPYSMLKTPQIALALDFQAQKKYGRRLSPTDIEYEKAVASELKRLKQKRG